MEQERPARVFISYAREDEDVKKQLVVHLSSLRKSGHIQFWEDSMIRLGEKWDQKIKKYLEETDIFLFLVSASLINSKYINDVELKTAFERCETGNAVLVPVIIKNCVWDNLKIGEFQVTPRNASPVTNRKYWDSLDEGLTQVALELRDLVGKWRMKSRDDWEIDMSEKERAVNLIVSKISEPDIRKLEKELRMSQNHWKNGFKKPDKWDDSYLFMYCNQQVNAINGLKKQAQRIDPSKNGFISRAINLIEGTLLKNEELKQLVESSGNEDTVLFEKIVQIEKGVVKLKRQIIKNVGEDPEENKLIQADGISTLSYYLEQLENELNIIREKSIFPN